MTKYNIRMKYQNYPWMYWGIPDSKDSTRMPRFMQHPSDEELINMTLDQARGTVMQQMLGVNTPEIHYQIKPFECDSNDPRIEDYQGGLTYDWSLNRPDKTDFRPLPEILITIEGGFITSIVTTEPRLFVNIIDHDQAEMGESFIKQYELDESYCGARAASLHDHITDVIEMYQREGDDEAYEYDPEEKDEPYDWQL